MKTKQETWRTAILLGTFIVGAAVLGAQIAGAKDPANWPGWRGPEGAGISAETNLPTEWGPSQNILWKTAIPGRGHSSPIIWGNRVFLTTAIEGEVIPGAKAPVHVVPVGEGKTEVFKHPDSLGADKRHTLKVFCLDRDTGKILWERTAHDGAMYDDRHKKSSYASATPVTDGKLVYAYFGTEGLFAYDFSGKLQWKFNPGKIATVGMGVATSPVLHGNLVILQVDEENGDNSYIVGLDKKSGKEAWRTSRKGIEVSWATPVIVTAAGGRAELVTSGNQFIIAYDPASGKELWRSAGVDSNAIPSPVAGHGMVYVTAGYPKKKVFAIKLGGNADITGTSQIAWKYEKGTAYVPSPILYGDYLYLTTDKGLITCLDAKTGEVKYEGGRPPMASTFTASLLAFDGKLLAVSDDGDAVLVAAGPEHKVLRTNSLGEAVYATPAIAAGRIFLRGAQHLYAIGK
ncbi:MAG TPA: PQQ-binding-like beta-propeller repeat protein [Candidatus Nitrosotenuis sp.]|nr:PQQ-binding-like beta-propeller repeat protein [Candidatus Nitrosotenuis sp.]